MYVHLLFLLVRFPRLTIVAFKVYDMDRDGFISNGELFIVLKMMVGNNLKDQQLQQVSAPLSLYSSLQSAKGQC